MSDILSIIDQANKAEKIDANHVSASRQAIFISPKISEQEAEALIRLANDEYILLELIRKEAPLISPLLDILLHESAGSEQPLAR